MVIATRGKCTFSTKARNAQEASASALLIVNNEEGLVHPPGPDGKDLGEARKPLYRLEWLRQITSLLFRALKINSPTEIHSAFTMLAGWAEDFRVLGQTIKPREDSGTARSTEYSSSSTVATWYEKV